MTFSDFTDKDAILENLGRRITTLKPYGLLRNGGPCEGFSLYFGRGERFVRCDGQRLIRVLAFCWESPFVLNYAEGDIIPESAFSEKHRWWFKYQCEAFARECAELESKVCQEAIA